MPRSLALPTTVHPAIPPARIPVEIAQRLQPTAATTPLQTRGRLKPVRHRGEKRMARSERLGSAQTFDPLPPSHAGGVSGIETGRTSGCFSGWGS
jgi:hypothetical protein